MKKTCITFFAIFILIASVIGGALTFKPQKTEYLRIHIRANSNLEKDQQVKMLVKSAVVDFLTPLVSEIDTTTEAEEKLTKNLSKIENVADNVLKNNGFSYRSKAKIKEEKFPTRTYGELILPVGYYDALIIELGEGEGDNWWCVIYPPLCFTGEGKNYVYKSKIEQIINKFFNKKQ